MFAKYLIRSPDDSRSWALSNSDISATCKSTVCWTMTVKHQQIDISFIMTLISATKWSYLDRLMPTDLAAFRVSVDMMWHSGVLSDVSVFLVRQICLGLWVVITSGVRLVHLVMVVRMMITYGVAAVYKVRQSVLTECSSRTPWGLHMPSHITKGTKI